MNRKNFNFYVKILLLFSIYFATGWFGLSLHAVARFATLIWFPSGIALASLLLFGRRLWPAIFIGAFLVNFLNGATFFVALGIGIGNTLEAVIGAFLLKKYKFKYSLTHLNDVTKLLFITPVGSIASATIGVSTLLIGSNVSFSLYFPTWVTWIVGDLISMLIVTPLVLVWSIKPYILLPWKRVLECIFLSLCILAVGMIVFRGFFGVPITVYPITYIVFPPLLWASLRFGQRGAMTSVFILSAFAVISTVDGYGIFARGSITERLLFLQLFMGVIAVTSMILASVEMERKELEQRKDDFISLASHELKTPLTSIKILTQILQTLDTNRHKERIVGYLEKMNMQIDKLVFLVNDLLDISKIQAKKLEFHKQHFSLLDLIKEIVLLIQTTTKTHTIVITDIIKQNDYVVYADRERISQVIINLLTNAIKYSPEAEKIIIRLHHEKNKVIVSITDFGVGISGEHHNKISQKYYRVYHEKTMATSGLGIGLFLAKEILRRSAGRLWFKSSLQKGSTFYFSLPVGYPKDIYN